MDKFESSPIIFGDFIKMGADPSDRLYEELADMKKIRNVLNEVHIRTIYCVHISYTIHVYTFMGNLHTCTYVCLPQYLDDFNMSSSKEMKLVFFMDAMEHVSRYVLAYRDQDDQPPL